MIVFITGASAGFSAAMARRFSIDDNRLIIAGRRKSRIDTDAAKLDPNVHTLELV